ncbi:hypothetical protein [Pseudonocardia sp. TRM90224]|uniref:hypothetical protein n=1 Tax=Pseudonocardia sp. TRM90224 TaxID=2812678 RepID=UPI001E59FA41|nr:hypothetical protein [Pseudonocardia sp. TRM90224]
MNEDRLTRRALITILLSGLATAVVALIGVAASGVLPDQVYRAQSVVVLAPAGNAASGENASLWESLGGGTQSQIAAAIFALPKFQDQAAAAAGVEPDKISVTAGVVESSVLINIKVDAPTAAAAETAADKIVELARPEIVASIGQFQVNPVQPASGTATPAGIPAGQMLVVVFIGGLLVGSGVALVVTRARSRKQEEAVAPAYESGEFRLPNSGEFRQPNSGEFRLPNPPPPPRRAPQRPNERPSERPSERPNGRPGGPNGAYGGPPPRRPAGDPPRPR